MEDVCLLEKSPHTNGTRRKNRNKTLKYELEGEDGVARAFYDNETLESYEIEDWPGHGERRPVRSTAFRYLMFCFAILFFLFLMYIPAYRSVNRQFGVIQGWSANTSRDTRTYVLPDNITVLNQPTKLCGDDTEKEKLFLLIVVCSATKNFQARRAIRETWANYQNYQMLRGLYANVSIWSKDMVITPSMVKDVDANFSLIRRKRRFTYNTNVNLLSVVRSKRQVISGIKGLVPALKEALEDNPYYINNKKIIGTENDNNNFVTEGADPRFDFGSENGGVEKTVIGNNLVKTYDDVDLADYEDATEQSNIMKIPARGFEDDIDIARIVENFKKQASSLENELKNARKTPEYTEVKRTTAKDAKLLKKNRRMPDFKVVFLLGMPQNDNTSDVQNKIDQEVEEFGDIIQEGFIDTYNNLTLKSVMLLKWVKTQCSNVQYIMKTDDDMFINVPNLIRDLKNKTFLCPSNKMQQKTDVQPMKEPGRDMLLMGVVFCGARPILDPNNKWYSPRYMYDGRVYPCYLSGTGYVMSLSAAKELYIAALDTPLFHLEDVYITGMCAQKAGIKPITHFGFSHLKRADNVCELYSSLTAHGAVPDTMRTGITALRNMTTIKQCEVRRLVTEMITQEKNKRNGRKYKYIRRTCI